ncbi:MAG: site-2 protease family protein [Chlamydiales bacterium]
MVLSVIYVILAALGLGFLIFIHELGHYFMAKRVGMRVETFSIGFGKPIYAWKHNEESWQIGWLPFGGYVKIAGMEPSDESEEESEDGFYKHSPWDRIKVAFMGPLVNLVFALLAFSVIWILGGRVKDFSEFTPAIGWVDTRSDLYTFGVRPGDEIEAYNSHSYSGVKDHIYAPLTAEDEVVVHGNFVDYEKDQKEPFSFHVRVYQHPAASDSDLKTAGILFPANYIIYDAGQRKELPSASPLHQTDLKSGDRIVWVDGTRIFSLPQLSEVLNDQRTLVTIQRGNEFLLRRVPRVLIEDLKIGQEETEELIDWQFESGLADKKIGKLYTIPYNLTPYGVVEAPLDLIDKETESDIFPQELFSINEGPLKAGDKIVAINGIPIDFSYEIFGLLQQKLVYLVVERDPDLQEHTDWKKANAQFFNDVNEQDLNAIVSSIGVEKQKQRNAGNLYLIGPIAPIKRIDYLQASIDNEDLTKQLQTEKERIESIENPEKKAHAKQFYQEKQNEFILGLPIRDRKVIYNPNPLQQFGIVFEEIWRTLSALFMGDLNPKWISGPIGIVQVVQTSWKVSLQEVLFWLGAISLNLGVLNLLPIPVLDGGYICIFFYEMVTGKRLKKKTLEKLIIPFVVIVVGFLLYATYNDLLRLFKGLL